MCPRESPNHADFGTLLYPDGADAHWNIRTPRRDPSANITGDIYWRIDDTSSSSIAIVDRYFIETLGLLPEDPDWELIGRDWVKPRQMDARARLHGTLIRRWLSAGLT